MYLEVELGECQLCKCADLVKESFKVVVPIYFHLKFSKGPFFHILPDIQLYGN